MSDPPPLTTYFFPEEIISGILLRVPIKPLMRFRSVCKTWRALITPELVKSQLLRSISATPEKVIFSTKHLKSSIQNHICNQIVDLDCPLINQEHYVQVLGTFNGFVCLVVSKSLDEKDVFIFTPSTGNLKPLPPPPDVGKFWVKMNFYSDETDDISGGFGFDSSIDDYKVVFVAPKMVPSSPNNRVMVLNLRDESWRISQGLYSEEFFAGVRGFRLTGTLSGALLNGALHWAAGIPFPMGPRRGDQLGHMRVIVYFDLADEVFKKMVPPDEIKPYSVGVLGEYLCAYCHGETSTQIWSMHEYGVNKSWVKLYDLPHNVITEKTGSSRLSSMVSVCYLRSGELLLLLDGQRLWVNIERESERRRFKSWTRTLAAYNPCNGTIRSVIIDGPYDMCVAALDAEWLVSTPW